eukprot:2347427-Rhodomonas_salina.3
MLFALVPLGGNAMRPGAAMQESALESRDFTYLDKVGCWCVENGCGAVPPLSVGWLVISLVVVVLFEQEDSFRS